MVLIYRNFGSAIDIVDIILYTLYAIRSGNWYLLLSYFSEIIPFAFCIREY